jgi:lipopolysaccharide transport system ATP-binding protein
MGRSPQAIDANADYIPEIAGRTKFRDTKLRNFSSGMQVRLAFSTAIQTNPEILLLDEVLAVGDMDFQRKCLTVLEQFKKQGVTIIFVSHDLDDISEHCGRAMLLNHGELVTIGETDEVIQKYQTQS